MSNFLCADPSQWILVAWLVPCTVLAGPKNKPLEHSLARYGHWRWQKLYIYISSLVLQCILLKKRIEGLLCPDFYKHSSSDLSAVNARCACWAKKQAARVWLARYHSWTQQKLFIYISSLYLQGILLKKRIQVTLWLVFYLPVEACRSWSHDPCPPKCPLCLLVPKMSNPGLTSQVMAFGSHGN